MIITEQLTENLNHAPTRMTFEIANTLQKKFGFDVEIITCASNEKLPFYIWIGASVTILRFTVVVNICGKSAIGLHTPISNTNNGLNS